MSLQEKLSVANTQKDLPTSPRTGARGFWGGANLSIGGGITPVHTTSVPPMVSAVVLSHKSENINPGLNMPTPLSPPPILSSSPFASSPLPGTGSGSDAFTDMNLFTLKTPVAYRGQLWNKRQRRTTSGNGSSTNSTNIISLTATGSTECYWVGGIVAAFVLQGERTTITLRIVIWKNFVIDLGCVVVL